MWNSSFGDNCLKSVQIFPQIIFRLETNILYLIRQRRNVFLEKVWPESKLRNGYFLLFSESLTEDCNNRLKLC